ncbi:PLP-dependent aminotransferase family protein [Paracoccus aestuarii]|uniref:PLP-dependent aminotransferase family protein n=1 Tax=Paracoccus aestuarii TaxID=453842 RepID=A0A418ZQU3_9RHOB|nr:PLP-dependent aminotransferase family protein [Paracoccus aestuarii]RJK98676.1 PLP-dependent aminotransferase family protein [Paracoccus aestuarii]WCQ98090.1 PLP-dependent aminotransferase family protein [Paracoccus aestuarii]
MGIEDWQPDLTGQPGPKFRALANALREAARSGQLAPGTRLPPMRDLAWRLKVTPGTVARAYQVAAAEGVVESHVGRGSFIAAPRPPRPAPQPLLYESLDHPAGQSDLVDLRIPQLPDCGQARVLARHLTALAADLDADLLDYTPLSRDQDCRDAATDWLGGRALGPVLRGDLVLTHGGQHAITLVMAITLADQAPQVMVEALTYPGIAHAARLMRARTLPVALDDQGMVPEALDRVARASGARLVCLTPSAQNPTLAGMGEDRRAAIVAVARRHDLQILEDECYAPAPGAGMPPSLRALAPERVWHVTSLSKIIAAGLRFGILLCPEGMGQAGRVAAQHSHMGLSQPITGLVTRLLRSGDGARIAVEVQALVEDRLALAQDILGGAGLRSQPGVPVLWLPLPPRWQAVDFVARAAAAGVIVRPASDFAGQGVALPQGVRIALNCRMPRDRLEVALRSLAQLVASSPDAGD